MILDTNKLSEYLNYFYETSTFPTKQIWKRIIQKSVFEHEEAKLQISISLTPEIIHFLQIHPTLNMHKAWEIAHSTPLLKKQAHHAIMFALRGGHGHLKDCAPFVKCNTLIFLCMLTTIAIILLKLETHFGVPSLMLFQQN